MTSFWPLQKIAYNYFFIPLPLSSVCLSHIHKNWENWDYCKWKWWASFVTLLIPSWRHSFFFPSYSHQHFRSYSHGNPSDSHSRSHLYCYGKRWTPAVDVSLPTIKLVARVFDCRYIRSADRLQLQASRLMNVNWCPSDSTEPHWDRFDSRSRPATSFELVNWDLSLGSSISRLTYRSRLSSILPRHTALKLWAYIRDYVGGLWICDLITYIVRPIVQQKVEISTWQESRDRSVSWHAEADLGLMVPSYTEEEDQMQGYGKCRVLDLGDIERLACRAISASAELSCLLLRSARARSVAMNILVCLSARIGVAVIYFRFRG